MVVFTVKFVNRKDDMYRYSSQIQELDDYDTIICHGSEHNVIIETNDGIEINFNAPEFANLIRNSSSYTGKAIRLISCSTGALDNGFAQQLANIMKVDVLAPTEAVWVNSYGVFFITNSDVLADMWQNGEQVKETGRWRLFKPQKGVAE